MAYYYPYDILAKHETFFQKIKLFNRSKRQFQKAKIIYLDNQFRICFARNLRIYKYSVKNRILVKGGKHPFPVVQVITKADIY